MVSKHNGNNNRHSYQRDEGSRQGQGQGQGQGYGQRQGAWAKVGRIAVCTALGAVILAAAPVAPAPGQPQAVAEAAGQHTIDDIRVALYLHSDLAFRSTVPYVTVSHPKGYGVSRPGEATAWVQMQPGESAQLSLDGYRVLLLETKDAAAADRAAQGMQSESPTIRKLKLAGADVYQVLLGPYATVQEAEAKRAVVQGSKLLGPVRWSAGTHATEAEARKQVEALAASGVQAVVAALIEGGKLKYAAWVGDAVDQASAEAMRKDVLKLAPGTPLTAITIDAEQPYAVIREVRLSDGKSGKAIDIPFGGPKLAAVAPEDGITIAEKDRRYRGKLEWSEFNGKLAVINELPFEQYLLAVVATEMPTSWPLEALKAQAVAARTYALAQGNRYKIAQVSDSTYDQAYFGMDREAASTTEAVQATAGEVLLSQGKTFLPFFSSNAGGMTAHPLEIWNNPVPYAKVTASPDAVAEQGKMTWFRVLLNDGKTGYIRSDLLENTGQKTVSGLPIMRGNTDGINVRPIPSTLAGVAQPIGTLQTKETVVKIGESVESNDYSWQRGPYTAAELSAKLGSTLNGAALRALEVTSTGQSGRVTSASANGIDIKVSSKDEFRGVFLGLPSTRFAIEETGRYTVLSGSGAKRELYGSAGEKVYAIGADGKATELTAPTRFVTDGSKTRVGTKDTAFLFNGMGNGHGVGMSQWGAKGLADEGYGYQDILQYYYQGVTLVKDGS